VNEIINYTLYSEYLSATGCIDCEESKITYVQHRDVRDAVIALMEALLSGYEKDIFSRICGCCGQCCVNRTVLMSALEIVAVSRHLGLSEALCRFWAESLT